MYSFGPQLSGAQVLEIRWRHRKLLMRLPVPLASNAYVPAALTLDCAGVCGGSATFNTGLSHLPTVQRAGVHGDR